MTVSTFIAELWRALGRQTPAFNPTRASKDGEAVLPALVTALARSSPAFTGDNLASTGGGAKPLAGFPPQRRHHDGGAGAGAEHGQHRGGQRPR